MPISKSVGIVNCNSNSIIKNIKKIDVWSRYHVGSMQREYLNALVSNGIEEDVGMPFQLTLLNSFPHHRSITRMYRRKHR